MLPRKLEQLLYAPLPIHHHLLDPQMPFPAIPGPSPARRSPAVLWSDSGINKPPARLCYRSRPSLIRLYDGSYPWSLLRCFRLWQPALSCNSFRVVWLRPRPAVIVREIINRLAAFQVSKTGRPARRQFCLFTKSKANMASRPLICPDNGQTGYGAAPAPALARNRNALKRPAAIVFAVCSSLVLFLVVMSQRQNEKFDLAQVVNDKIDADYLQAEASGKSGREFLKKLQDMWFVAQYRSDLSLANFQGNYSPLLTVSAGE
jgi:hypothetical protein